MRFTVGFAAGVATVWAALAIWRRLPAFPDVDVDDEPTIDEVIDRIHRHTLQIAEETGAAAAERPVREWGRAGWGLFDILPEVRFGNGESIHERD